VFPCRSTSQASSSPSTSIHPFIYRASIRLQGDSTLSDLTPYIRFASQHQPKGAPVPKIQDLSNLHSRSQISFSSHSCPIPSLALPLEGPGIQDPRSAQTCLCPTSARSPFPQRMHQISVPLHQCTMRQATNPSWQPTPRTVSGVVAGS